MSRGLLVVLLLAGGAAACGGSQRSTSSGAPHAVVQSSTSSPTSTGPTATKHKRPHGRSRSHATRASNVRLPATYVIRPGGALSPTLVSAPAAVTIALTITSSDGHAHHVAVSYPNARTALVVAAGGQASMLLSGLKAGSYGIFVDGVRRGALLIGVAPGP